MASLFPFSFDLRTFFSCFFFPFALPYVYVRLSLLPSSFDPSILFFLFPLLYSNFALFVEISSWCTTLMTTVRSFAQTSLFSSFALSHLSPFAFPPTPKMADNSCFLICHPQIVTSFRIGNSAKHPSSIPICTLQSKTPPLAITSSSCHRPRSSYLIIINSSPSRAHLSIVIPP